MKTAILVGEILVASGVLAWVYKAVLEQVVELGWLNRHNREMVE